MLPVSSVTDKSINVLNGLISFLPSEQECKRFVRYVECVNALNGLISFLQGLDLDDETYIDKWCQCPKRANLISTGCEI